MSATVAGPAQASVFQQASQLHHEQVSFCHDADTGLRAIIGIHSTVLGPALGGLRFWNYSSEADAVFDVMRLSRGMTFKAALAGLNLGGGKAIIMGDARSLKSEALLRRFGRFVEDHGGKYITAEDVNIGVADIEFVRQETEHAVGISEERGGSGDPSPVTAYGVYLGLKAARQFRSGSDSLEGQKVMVQGAGKVGGYLVERLRKDGATVYVHDVNEEATRRVCQATGAIAVEASQVYSIDCDIFAPCALGAGLNPDTIPQLKCGIVAGGANNQLLDEARDGQALRERDILYVPDFLLNAGGLINVSVELEGYNRALALHKAEGIYDTALRVLNLARETNVPTQEAAIRQAVNRIQSVGSLKKYW